MIIYYYTNDYYELDNFSAHAVKYKGLVFPTAEHAYQAEKHTDLKIKEEIRSAKSPLESKNIANKKYGAKKRSDWGSVKLKIMEEVKRAKVSQHLEVRKALIRSGKATLAELSEKDLFWGMNNKGKGENHLGKIWMKIREELRSH